MEKLKYMPLSVTLTLQRCNAMMLSSRQQDGDFVPPEIDGIL